MKTRSGSKSRSFASLRIWERFIALARQFETRVSTDVIRDVTDCRCCFRSTRTQHGKPSLQIKWNDATVPACWWTETPACLSRIERDRDEHTTGQMKRSRISLQSVFVFYVTVTHTVMSSPRGQIGLEAIILSLSLSSKICPWPRLWPWVFVLDMSLNFSFGPCDIVCNASIGNIYKFAMVS